MVVSTVAMPVIRVKEVHMSDLQNVSFRIKTASFELEYKGSEKFLLEKLRQVTNEFAEVSFNGTLGDVTLDNAIQSNTEPLKAIKGDLTTHAIARKLDAKAGKEVAIAAMAKLRFVDSQNSPDRRMLLSAMRDAEPIFKENMASNLTQIIDGLLKKGLLVKLKNNKFSLSDNEIQKLETVLLGNA